LLSWRRRAKWRRTTICIIITSCYFCKFWLGWVPVSTFFSTWCYIVFQTVSFLGGICERRMHVGSFLDAIIIIVLHEIVNIFFRGSYYPLCLYTCWFIPFFILVVFPEPILLLHKCIVLWRICFLFLLLSFIQKPILLMYYTLYLPLFSGVFLIVGMDEIPNAYNPLTSVKRVNWIIGGLNLL